jgi:hypothetical protein
MEGDIHLNQANVVGRGKQYMGCTGAKVRIEELDEGELIHIKSNTDRFPVQRLGDGVPLPVDLASGEQVAPAEPMVLVVHLLVAAQVGRNALDNLIRQKHKVFVHSACGWKQLQRSPV